MCHEAAHLLEDKILSNFYEDRPVVARFLKSWLMTPSVWLAAALMLFAAAIALGYHQDQQIAVEKMAKPRGPAPLVTIQNFDSAAHSNLAGEVRLIAEVNFSNIYEIEFGPLDKREAAILIPLYPVSDAGWMAVRREVEGKTSPRPVLREDVNQDHVVPVGAILSRAPAAISSVLYLDHLVSRRIGAGTSGSVVEISGVEIQGFTENPTIVPMRGPFPIEMSAMPVIVEPTGFAAPLAAHDPAIHGEERELLTRVGIVFLLLAALFAVRPAPKAKRRRHTPRPAEAPAETKAMHRTFQPIRTQDEIFDAEDAEAAAEVRRRREATLLGVMAFKSRR